MVLLEFELTLPGSVLPLALVINKFRKFRGYTCHSFIEYERPDQFIDFLLKLHNYMT